MHKYSNTTQAKKAARLYYSDRCIFTGVEGKLAIPDSPYMIVGAHIFPAGAWAELKCYRENIIPMQASYHTSESNTFDWEIMNKRERSIPGKIHMLMTMAKPDLSNLLADQFQDLLLLLHQKNLGYEMTMIAEVLR